MDEPESGCKPPASPRFSRQRRTRAAFIVAHDDPGAQLAGFDVRQPGRHRLRRDLNIIAEDGDAAAFGRWRSLNGPVASSRRQRLDGSTSRPN
jgi:hypothetical protein